MYCSHYDSRKPKVGIQQTCICYRQLKPESQLCDSCTLAEEFIYDVRLGTLPLNMLKAMKPINCLLCDMRFADNTILQHHRCGNEMNTTIIPKNLSTKELKEQLLKLKLPANESKTVSCTRL